MAKESSILGIDLHEQEIRVVQINCRSNKPSLGKIGRAPMPEGAVSNGRILHPGPVAVALRLLLNSMGIEQTSRAVVGVLGDGTSLRTLSVPPVPDPELPTIIAGEVAHYGLVHSPGGAYGFLRLYPHTRSGSESPATKAGGDKRETFLDPEVGDQSPAVVTVIAVEEDVIFSIKETVEQANLTIEAIEPCQYGMYRSLMLAAGPSATLFALMVSPANTDIAFIHEGQIVGYRRIDIGSRLLTLVYTTSAEAPGAPAPESSTFDEYDRSRMAPSGGDLNRLAAESLSVEIQRTLNYYMREFPDANIEDHLYLAIDDARIDDLAREFTMALGVTVEPFRPSVIAQDGSESANEAGSRLGAIYAAALGLAVHGQILSRVPRLDLFSKQRAGVQQAETQRNFMGSIITSLLAIVLAIAGYFLYHKQIVDAQKVTDETNARTQKLQTEMDQTVADRRKHEDQYKALRNEGVPVTEVMDYIAYCIKPGTGLSTVIIAPDLSVTIRGQSTNEQQMIQTNESLQKCPFLTDMRIYSFKQLDETTGGGVGFEIRGQTMSVGRVKLPEDVKKLK